MKVTLTVLASDIREDQFMSSERCAGTKAMKRAGFNRVQHCGTHWMVDGVRMRVDEGQPIEPEFNYKLLQMYNGARAEKGDRIYAYADSDEQNRLVVTPEDFTMDVEIPDDWSTIGR